MFGLLTFISSIFTAKDYVKEKIEKPVPSGTRFDWDSYWNDVGKLTTQEQIKKRQRGGYNTITPSPKKWYDMPYDALVDVERYENDKKIMGEKLAEQFRKDGMYRTIRKTY